MDTGKYKCLSRWASVICAVALFWTGLAGSAQAEAQALEDAPFEKLDAKAYLLMEKDSGQIVFGHNETEQRPIASMTKIMSLLVILDELKAEKLALDTPVTVSKNAASTEGSEAILDADYAYPARDLIKAVIVSSANDATVALAEHCFGSEAAFVKRMNGRAKDMDMTDTVFDNCTGLPAGDAHSTPVDVAKMSRELLNEPLFHEYSNIWMDTMTHKNGRVSDMVNTNRLVRFYEGTTGVKTGSTNEAGYCIAASAKRGNTEFIAIVFGSSTSAKRFAAAQQLLTYGFDHYRLEQPIQQDQLLREQVIVKGRGRVDIVAGETLHLLLRKDDNRTIECRLEMAEELQGNVAPGQEVGRVVAQADGVVLQSVPAVVGGEWSSPSVMDGLWRILSGWMWW